MMQLGWVISQIINICRSWDHCALRVSTLCWAISEVLLFGNNVSTTISCAQSYSSKVFRVQWYIRIWGGHELKDTILVAFHIPVMLLSARINFPCWNQGYCGHTHERGVSIQLWEFLIHRYPTKTSANSNGKVVWLEDIVLLIKNKKHTACEKQPVAAVVLSSLPAPVQPRSHWWRCHSPSAWRRWRKEAIRAAAFPQDARFSKETWFSDSSG